MTIDQSAEPGPSFVVCGDNPLVYQLALRLVTRFVGGTVTVVLPDRGGSFVPQLEQLERVHIQCAARIDETTLRAAGVAEARALALVDQGDVENFHSALRAHELNPGIRLVIRMFNTGLGFRIRTLFADCVVMSMSEMAAPSFIAAAMNERAVDYLRLSDRTLFVADATEVSPEQVVCGLAAGPGEEIALVPPAVAAAGRRSFTAPGRPSAASGRVLALAGRTPYSPGRPRLWLSLIRYLVRHSLIRLLSGLVAFIALCCCLLVLIGTGWGTAVYETMLDAAGAAAPEADKSLWFKLFQLAITFTGLAMTPVITALVVGGVLRAQLDDFTAPDPARYEDHVVVAGLGNVGMRVLEQLSDLGVRVVGLDYDENARGVPQARALGVPVVIGQATWEDTLRAAGVARARALVLLTSSNAVNLEAAMLGQSYRDDLRVVLRLSDDDLADRVQRSLDKAVVRSVFQLAADGFAAAMSERRVIATLSVDQATLMIAEVPVQAGSDLVGKPLGAADLPEHARVIALQRDAGAELYWQPAPETALAQGNQLVVVTTRTGLNQLLERTEGAPGDPPEPVAVLA